MLSPAIAESTRPDLYCQRPTPLSGLTFTGIIPHLARNRRVIAPDYPGYGGSGAHAAEPSINDYAKAMQTVIDDLRGGRVVDVMGFHAGRLVGAQMFLDHPVRIGRAILIDVPTSAKEMRAELLPSNAQPLVLTQALECLATPWASGITRHSTTHGRAAYP